ncbi:ATP-binding protein [Streptomyces varsoviensis]|uniref:ATP-binding protein n=1 Tax=Streptomyces varsoviensis TaxID=67373 RepID=UPI0033D3FEA0
MDPMDRGPEDHEGRDGDERRDGRTPTNGAPRPAAHERTAQGPGGDAPALARTVQLIAGDYLLTINPVDGSEIEVCPPADRPGHPDKHLPEERAELRRAAAPPPPAGTTGSELPFLGRDEERERLVRLLARGRSVRLTGPPGAGRTTLLDAVAEDCATLAPDGVVRLSGYRRTSTDLLYDLFAAVHRAPLHRPDRDELLALVGRIGAVVVLDDLEFGGAALDDLLDATPECAFLIAATPDVAAPSADSHLEEVFLGGLGRETWLELLARAVRRPPAADEAGWAADLWFESEGLPLRYVQAGALLRQRDAARADSGADAASLDEQSDYSVFGERPADAAGGSGVPLPSTAEAAEPAALLAARLGETGQDTLRIAVALGGELPHQAHLPALVGDAHADAALGELIDCGLITPAGAHYRLAGGVLAQLQAAGYGTDTATHAQLAAQHYAWWAGHPSVTPERTAVEADAILAAMGVLVAGREAGHPAAAVLLARTAAPAFAAALRWSAWERSLRYGQEAARIAGEVAEEAYFHHELGILALCTGNLDRARAELEASIGLRGVLADRRGTVAGRRALALVADRSGRPVVPPPTPDGYTPAGEEVPDARSEESASPPGGLSAPPAAAGPDDNTTTIITRLAADGGAAPSPVPPPPPARKAVVGGTRRNLVAAGAGVLLAAVLGTVVTLGATSGGDKGPSDKVKPGQSAAQQDGDDGLTADKPGDDRSGRGGGPGHTGTAGKPGPTTSTDGPSQTPSPSGSASPNDPTGSGEPSHTPSSPSRPTDGTTEPTGSPSRPTNQPTHTQSPTGKPTPTDSPTKPTQEPTTPQSPTTGPSTSQTVTQSASQSAPASQTQSGPGAPTASRTA